MWKEFWLLNHMALNETSHEIKHQKEGETNEYIRPFFIRMFQPFQKAKLFVCMRALRAAKYGSFPSLSQNMPTIRGISQPTFFLLVAGVRPSFVRSGNTGISWPNKTSKFPVSTFVKSSSKVHTRSSTKFRDGFLQ